MVRNGDQIYAEPNIENRLTSESNLASRPVIGLGGDVDEPREVQNQSVVSGSCNIVYNDINGKLNRTTLAANQVIVVSGNTVLGKAVRKWPPTKI